MASKRFTAGKFANMLKANGMEEEFKGRIKWVKKRFQAEHGFRPIPPTSTNLWWGEAEEYYDKMKGLEAGQMAAEEAEPEPDSRAVEQGPSPEADKFDPAVFKGRDCSNADSIKWAAEHISAEVTIDDAPSILAWSTYLECRDNPGLRPALFTTLVAKIMPKPKDEGGDSMTDDGGIINLLDQIEKLSEEAKEDDDAP